MINRQFIKDHKSDLAVGIVGLAVGCKMFGKTILKYVAKNTAPALERLARGFEGARQRC